MKYVIILLCELGHATISNKICSQFHICFEFNPRPVACEASAPNFDRLISFLCHLCIGVPYDTVPYRAKIRITLFYIKLNSISSLQKDAGRVEPAEPLRSNVH